MAELPEPIVPDQIPEDDRNFDPLPAGLYRLQVIDSAINDTKSGTGKILTLTEEVLEGDYAGRRIWDRLNIQNENPDAQRIAQRSLADLCLAIEVTELTDSEDLHFKPFTGRVTIQPSRDPQYGPSNKVRYVLNNGQPPAGKQDSQPNEGEQEQQPQPQSQQRAQQARQQPQGQRPQGQAQRPTQAPKGGNKAPFGSKPWANKAPF